MENADKTCLVTLAALYLFLPRLYPALSYRCSTARCSYLFCGHFIFPLLDDRLPKLCLGQMRGIPFAHPAALLRRPITAQVLLRHSHEPYQRTFDSRKPLEGCKWTNHIIAIGGQYFEHNVSNTHGLHMHERKIVRSNKQLTLVYLLGAAKNVCLLQSILYQRERFGHETGICATKWQKSIPYHRVWVWIMSELTDT